MLCVCADTVISVRRSRRDADLGRLPRSLFFSTPRCEMAERYLLFLLTRSNLGGCFKGECRWLGSSRRRSLSSRTWTPQSWHVLNNHLKSNKNKPTRRWP